MHLDSAVFSRDLGIVQHDIRTRPAQYHSSLAQPKNLTSSWSLDNSERDGLFRGKLWGSGRSLDAEIGMTLLALSLQLGFAGELLLVHGAVRATMGTFNDHDV